MRTTGLVFVLFALSIIVFFIGQMFVSYGPKSRPGSAPPAWVPENPDDAALPVTPDPSVDDVPTFDIRVDDDDVLTSAEMKLVYRNADYEYTIKPGDDIDALARKYLGDHGLKDLLYDFNRQLIRGQKLRPGEKITIPFRYRR